MVPTLSNYRRILYSYTPHDLLLQVKCHAWGAWMKNLNSALISDIENLLDTALRRDWPSQAPKEHRPKTLRQMDWVAVSNLESDGAHMYYPPKEQ